MTMQWMNGRERGAVSDGVATDLALVPVRASLAATMLYHGLDKLRPERREQTAVQFHKMGVRPGGFWAMATGIAETIAGISMAAGVFTRPAALAVLVTQAVAIGKVHAPKGFPATKGGYEFNLALMAIAAGILAVGPGRASLSRLVARSTEPRTLGGRLARRFRPPSWRARLLSLLA
jgi:putative oxidoreductase